jgi:hypothetical protein
VVATRGVATEEVSLGHCTFHTSIGSIVRTATLDLRTLLGDWMRFPGSPLRSQCNVDTECLPPYRDSCHPAVAVAVAVSARVAVVVGWVGARGEAVGGRANPQGWRVKPTVAVAVGGAGSHTGTRATVQCTFWRTPLQVWPPTP